MQGNFPPLNKSRFVVGDNVQRMASIMLYGLSGPLVVRGETYGTVPMVGLGGSLSDDELAAIGTYVRSAWDNEAGPLEPELFFFHEG